MFYETRFINMNLPIGLQREIKELTLKRRIQWGYVCAHYVRSLHSKEKQHLIKTFKKLNILQIPPDLLYLIVAYQGTLWENIKMFPGIMKMSNPERDFQILYTTGIWTYMQSPNAWRNVEKHMKLKYPTWPNPPCITHNMRI